MKSNKVENYVFEFINIIVLGTVEFIIWLYSLIWRE